MTDWPCPPAGPALSEVLTDPLDKHNHIWDAVRYALEPVIRQSGMALYEWMRQQAEALVHPR